MLSPIKYWLEKRNWYLQVRYHPSVISIWLRLRKHVARNLMLQGQVYKSILKDVNKKLIIDAGANEGFLTSIFSSLGFDVIAVEPSQRNFSVLKTRFRRNANIILIPAALSDKEEEKNFFENNKDYAVGTLSEKWKNIGNENYAAALYKHPAAKIQTITLDGLIKKYGIPGFIKIDVEGYEEKVIKGLSQPIPVISFEAILPHFLSETIDCINHLWLLSTNARFNYARGNGLVYEQFISKDELIAAIQPLQPQTIEIFCKS